MAAPTEFVFEELSAIRGELELQLSALSKKEADFKEREIAFGRKEALAYDKLEEKESSLKKRETLLLEVEATCHTFIQDYIQEESKLLTKRLEEDCYHIKKENSRLKDGLKTISSVNEKLKKQLEAEKLRANDLERKVSTLHGRLSCLKVDHAARFKQQAPEKPDQESKLPIDGILQKDHHTKDHPYRIEQQELLGKLVYHLMQWVTHGSTETLVSPDVLATTTFPPLAVLMPNLSSQYHHTCLQFICEVVLNASTKTKSLLNSSLRRIGEVCAASLTGTHSYPLKLSQRDHVFCSSCDIKIRVLSCLLILQTISQVDAVNLALQNLKCDLRQTGVQKEFISFGGIGTLLSYVSVSSKCHVSCGTALDVMILLSSDSGITHFLNSGWFNAVAALLKDERLPSLQLEKLSILLQRLSGLRQSKMLFNRSEILPLLQSLLTSRKMLTSFIQLNISSTINNLTQNACNDGALKIAKFAQ